MLIPYGQKRHWNLIEYCIFSLLHTDISWLLSRIVIRIIWSCKVLCYHLLSDGTGMIYLICNILCSYVRVLHFTGSDTISINIRNEADYILERRILDD